MIYEMTENEMKACLTDEEQYDAIAETALAVKPADDPYVELAYKGQTVHTTGPHC